ncbi:GTP 3',8-cyclase MoaA [Clostridia bacterium]|nr:GTP 3',8-cyclase MoaA [Clostridia bacterium]
MKDNYQREIDYLRIAVTDRCNLRCTYCMPEEGIEPKRHDEILSLEEIIRLVQILVKDGIRKIRLTGGEPLVRKNIEALVRGIHGIEGIEEISLTTNGILLEKLAVSLKKAGLDRVNVSLDTLKKDKYHAITRLGELDKVIRGIKAAQAAGLNPVKVNAVAIRGFNEDELVDFATFAIDNKLTVRFIELMPVGESSENGESYISMEDILNTIRKKYELAQIPRGPKDGPSSNYQIVGTEGRIGVIAALTNHFCADCNRMRLTADGKFRPCLFSSTEFDVRELLRDGSDDEKIQALYHNVLGHKPKEHRMEYEKYECKDRRMSQIGG